MSSKCESNGLAEGDTGTCDERCRRHPNNETAAQIVKGFAEILANRFDWTVGCTRSWDSSGTNFQVIIDNMVNLDVRPNTSSTAGRQPFDEPSSSLSLRN